MTFSFEIIFSGIGVTLITGVGSLIYLSLKNKWSIDDFKSKLDKLENRIDKLETIVIQLGNTIAQFGERLASLEGAFSAHKDFIKFIQEKSPLGLTDDGEALLKGSGGKDFVNKNKGIFIKEINKENPQTAYDVQELSCKIIENHSKDKDFIPIKKFLYKKPTDLTLIFKICGIYLRDLYLEAHPEIEE